MLKKKKRTVNLKDLLNEPGGQNSSTLTRSLDKLIATGTAQLADLIAPPSCEIHTDYINTGNECSSILAVTNWPETVNVGWFRQLVDRQKFKTDITVHYHPVPHAMIEHWLNRKSSNTESSLALEEKQGKNPQAILSLQQHDIQVMKEMVVFGGENFFQATLLVMVYGGTKEELAINTQEMMNRLKEVGIEAKPFYMRQRQGLESILPWGMDTAKAYHNFYSSALATGFPFMTGGLRVADGVCYGLTLGDNVPIFYDIFNKQGGFHKVIMGTTGSGKSFFTKTMAARYAMRGVDILVIDPSQQLEYKNFAEYLGGTVVEVSPTSSASINPFDIAQVEQQVRSRFGIGEGEQINVMAEKLNYLIGLFGLMAGGGLSDMDQAILGDLLRTLYESKGIYNGKEETYSRQAPTMGDFDVLLKTLYFLCTTDAGGEREFLSRIENNTALAGSVVGQVGKLYMYRKYTLNDIYTPEQVHAIGRIRGLLQPYITGYNAGLFGGDGKTTVKADTQVVVFRVGDCPEDLLELAMYIVFGEVYNRVLAGGGSLNKIVVFDEAWKLLRRQAATKSIHSLIREGRKMGTGIWMISQSPADFDTPEGKIALTQAQTRVLMKVSSDDAEIAGRLFNLPPSLYNRVPNFTSGIGLLLLDGKSVNFYLEATEEEAKMASTSPKSFGDGLS